MSHVQLGAVVRHIRTVVASEETRGLSDRQLLDQFVVRKDPAAFAVLVQRHGPLVLGVCRHLLGNEQDTEDAFQATFLVLARKAGSIHKGEALAAWLHGVAYRTAMKAKRDAARRRAHEARAGRGQQARNPYWDAAWREVQAVLDEEVQRLPPKYRSVFVLCCLEGHGRAEAAQQLGLKEGTVRSRLSQARKQLQRRLARRGITLSAVLSAAALAPSPGRAELPAGLANAAVRAASPDVAGGIADAAVSANVIALAEGVIRTTLVPKAAAPLLLAVAMFATAAGVMTHRMTALEPLQAGQSAAPQASQEAPDHGKTTHPDRVRTDLYGDPLPQGAIARLGSIQWRHPGLNGFVLLDGGQTALSVGADRNVRTWDLARGKLLRRVELSSDPGWRVALSPDGKILAADAGGKIVCWATESGKEIKSLGTGKAGVNHLQFSPDGKLLAAGTGDGRVSIWDWQIGKELALPGAARDSLDSTFHTCFSPDGKWLAVGFWWLEPLRLYETATGREVRRFDCRAVLSTFSPDGKRLAVSWARTAGNPENEIRLFDRTTGRDQARFPLGTADFPHTLVFSPDGKMLAWGGYSQSCLIDVTNGQVRHRWPGLAHLAFTPDGKIVAGNSGPGLRFFDTSTGKELHDRPSSFSGLGDGIDQVAISPDGRRLASLNQRENAVFLWDTANGRLARRLVLSSPTGYTVSGVAFAPDGGTLLVGRWNGAVEFWDIAGGKEARTVVLQDRVRLDPERFGYQLLHVSADGKQLSTFEKKLFGELYHCRRLAVWETTKGKLVRDYPIPYERSVCSWSADGSVLALSTADGVELREIDSGRVCCRLPGPFKGGIVAASCDQRLIAVLGRKEEGRPSPGQMIKDGEVGIWEAKSGREVARIAAGPAAHLALVAGGRCLVTTDESFLRVWDLATGTERRRWALPPGSADSRGTTMISHLFALPDGRRVVTSLYDGTALVWDLSPALDFAERLAKTPGEKAIAGWWADLAGADAKRAYTAVWRLADTRGPAVHFLREHLRPVPEPDMERIRRHVRDLGSDTFAVREKAFKELESLGSAAVPALRQVLEQDPSPEIRRRVERLLAKPLDEIAPAETLRALRALHALEQMDTPDARVVIRRLARGASEAPLTRAAKACLERLARRPSTG